MPGNHDTDGVAADMERIFRPLAGRALVTAFHHDVPPRRGRAGPGWRRAALAAPALVVFVTAALAIGYRGTDRPPERREAVTAVAPLPPAPVRPAAVIARAPEPSLPAPAPSDDEAPAVRRSTVEPGPVVDFARSPGAPSPAALPTPAPTPRAVAAVARPPEPAARPVAPPAAAPAAPRRERADPPPPFPDCPPGSPEDRCIYRDVLAADARLRRAYRRAEAEGVSRALLSSAGRRWNRAARDAEDDPDGVIERYGLLADALDDERRAVSR